MSLEHVIKRIAIFGSTGSIGIQALEVIQSNPDKFSVEILTAFSNDELLIEQAKKFKPNIVVIGDEKKYLAVKDALATEDIKVFAGEKSLEEVAGMDCYDLMLAGIVGFAESQADIESNWCRQSHCIGKQRNTGGGRRYCNESGC